MSRLDPKSREEAFSHQFEDDVKVIKAVAHHADPKEFEIALATLESHIGAYRSKKLKKELDKYQKKQAEHNAWMKKNYPKEYKKWQKKFPHLYK